MIRIYPDGESLSRGAAELFVGLAQKAIEERGRFMVALSGGDTPRRTYELLAQSEFGGRIDWAGTHIFWGDERCVPPTDSRSNERMAREALLDHVPVPESRIHPMRCAESPAESALVYENLLHRYFDGHSRSFDLVLLGLGKNGHTASLFPHTPVLKERTRWVREVFVAEQGLYRLTLTPPAINSAATVVFVVSGGAKAETLKAVAEGTGDPDDLPALLIRPEGGGVLRWLAEKDAAARL